MKSYSLVDNKQNPIDFKLFDIINKENGFFIELGANDGITQSNTAFFEFYKNWTGILIEPSVNKYEECKLNRPNNIVLNCACVSSEYDKDHIVGDFHGSLMASVDGKRLNGLDLVSVKVKTLESILDIYINNRKIDLLSLDTEGYELNILKGLNLNKYRPKFMIIEVYNKDYNELLEYLTKYNYILHSNISNYNYNDNPGWDGTHNDFLFVDDLNSIIC